MTDANLTLLVDPVEAVCDSGRVTRGCTKDLDGVCDERGVSDEGAGDEEEEEEDREDEEEGAELILAALEGLRVVGELVAALAAMGAATVEEAEICTAVRLLDVAGGSRREDDEDDGVDEKIAEPGGDDDTAFLASSACAALVAGGFLKLQMLHGGQNEQGYYELVIRVNERTI